MGTAEYLIVLGACVLITLPLELRARVYRRPSRLVLTVLPVSVLFLVWDALAIAAGAWNFDPAFITGIRLPGGIPVEEALFFVIIPTCAILTFEAVKTTSALLARLRTHKNRVKSRAAR
ncbi:MAG TPA: lycopene cyclase domain-containing protein [Amycolatopsis sp.]|uniref:lycopene cyclase domain-containing protein n=1 Tax=Amycolatopsis sp. TaxID=37632 RepID=UPI002B47C47F|nr:lycopene cyclase domain-containing protein [Amycolatopsis sp.]HKS46113.1 lycopene cyclase domain-containing protein [Amycolatopsis sp.]